MKNSYRIDGSDVWIKLERRFYPPLETVIDLYDLPLVLQLNSLTAQWSPAAQTFYVAVRPAPNVCAILHRFITNCPARMVVDHRDHNGLNNRRGSNLRICTQRENVLNRRLVIPPRTSLWRMNFPQAQATA